MYNVNIICNMNIMYNVYVYIYTLLIHSQFWPQYLCSSGTTAGSAGGSFAFGAKKHSQGFIDDQFG
jgi:hypothetical protein